MPAEEAAVSHRLLTSKAIPSRLACGLGLATSRTCERGQARGGSDWKYDTFLIVSADAKRLEIDVYRNLKVQGQFEVTDRLLLPEMAAPKAAPKMSTAAP